MQKQKQTTEGQRALLIRIGEYDMTPALARFVSVLQSMEPTVQITVLCWGLSGAAQTGVRPPPGVEFIRHEASASSHAPIRAFLAVLLWWLKVARVIISGRFALVQPSDVISMIPCAALRPILRFGFVVDVRDPVRSISEHWGWKAGMLGIVESVGLRMAQRVVICDKHRRRFVPTSVLHKERDLVIRNLPDTDAGYRAKPIDGAALKVCFSGYINSRRGVGMLMGALEQCPFVQLHVVGSSSEPGLEDALAEHPQVIMHGRVSRNKALCLMADCSLAALLYDPSVELNRYASPNKYYEALMLGVPILTCDGTPMASEVRKEQCGFAITYDDIDALAECFQQLRSDPATWKQSSVNARQLYEDSYRWEHDAAKLVDAYQQLLATP